MEKFDAIVIGGGSAGYAAASTFRENCDRVAIVDDSDELGGLCILRGCMPSKTVIYSAEVLHLARQGKRFGLHIPEAKADMKALHERKVRMIDDFKSYRQEQLQSGRFELFRERGQFINESTFRLNESGRDLSAEKFVVATGSCVNFPDIKGLDAEGIWTSDDVLDLDFLPESVIMLGGGIVACELAQFLIRMGSKVIQVQRSPLILRENSNESARVIMRVFQEEGIELYTGTNLKEVIKENDGFSAVFEKGGETCTVSAKHLVNALGRRPVTDGLGLGSAGVHLTPAGQIRVDKFQQTTNRRIYAAGDVTGPYEIVHIAIMQGETAARHAMGIPAEPVDLDSRTFVLFTDPQVASAGLPYQEAREQGMDLVVAEYPFDDHGKSILMEARHGYVRTWADRTNGRLIGAECVGKDAAELIHAMSVAVKLKATVDDLLQVHWYHPTLSEIWSYPLEDLQEELK